MAPELLTASNGGSVTVHHMTKAQVSKLLEVFAYPVQLEDGSLGWRHPLWIDSLMLSARDVDLHPKG